MFLSQNEFCGRETDCRNKEYDKKEYFFKHINKLYIEISLTVNLKGRKYKINCFSNTLNRNDKKV